MKTPNSVKNHRQRRKKTCIKHRLQKSNDLDFSICGDYKVEGDEECDCGMSYLTCSDPCCYAAHISPDDLSWNSTAVPCRTHRSPICINPFRFVDFFPHCSFNFCLQNRNSNFSCRDCMLPYFS